LTLKFHRGADYSLAATPICAQCRQGPQVDP
jgi:hypothetical protein